MAVIQYWKHAKHKYTLGVPAFHLKLLSHNMHYLSGSSGTLCITGPPLTVT